MWIKQEAYGVGVVHMTRVLDMPLMVTTMAVCTLGQGCILQPSRGLLAIDSSILQSLQKALGTSIVADSKAHDTYALTETHHRRKYSELQYSTVGE